MARVYLYVVDRDFGFAPNPFHGVCTLATCKPDIRRTAKVGDWVLGMGGSRLKATGQCIFAMKVDETLSFDDYWESPLYRAKRPIRNGSMKMLLGDNIYHREAPSSEWQQEDSHHSMPDGSINMHNVVKDTKTNRVLISKHFFYFGEGAPPVPQSILDDLGYKNNRSYRVFEFEKATPIISWLNSQFHSQLNLVAGDPFDFSQSSARYSGQGSKLTASL